MMDFFVRSWQKNAHKAGVRAKNTALTDQASSKMLSYVLDNDVQAAARLFCGYGDPKE